MSIVVVGISHKTTPVEIRECLAFAKSRVPEALHLLANGQAISEAIIVSTCKRVEVIAATKALIVGEPQITGQVKEAFQLAQENGSVAHTLTRLMNRAFAVAPRVRNETVIGSNSVSISYVAVELARKVFESLNGATVTLIGAGEMAARHLLNCRASKILIANCSDENAVKLAEEMNGEAVRTEYFERRMAEAD